MELLPVCSIGKYEREKIERELGNDRYLLFIENPNDTGSYKTVFEIHIDKDFKYDGIFITEYRSELLRNYLYKKGSSRGADYSPTAKITQPDKTLENKVIKAYKDALESYEEYDEIEVVRNIWECLHSNKEDILKEMNEKFDSKSPTIATVVYDGKYPGDFEIFKEKLLLESLESYYKIDKKDSKSRNKVCSVCRDEKPEVLGSANIFKFYTVDKPGYVSGGFKKLDSWRNFPVCEDCAVELELGKKYMDENLSFRFQGRDFYIIPKLLNEKGMDRILNTLRELKKESFESSYEYREEIMMKRMAKLENNLTLELLFYEESNAALNIKLSIQDVLPSRFRAIYESMTRANVLTKGEESLLSFSYLNNLFPRKNYNRYFLEVVDSIIANKRIDYGFIISHVKNHIVEKFNEADGAYFYIEFIKSYLFLIYLRDLNLLFKERGEVEFMKKFYWDIKEYKSKEEMLESIFEDSMDFFDTPDKRAVFLVGLLAKKLLNIQYAKERRQPFKNRLKGLKLSERDIKRLVPEIQAKLTEYKSSYYGDIESLVGKYMLMAGNNWKTNSLDIPFYFAMGMNLERNIKFSNKEEGEIGDDKQ